MSVTEKWQATDRDESELPFEEARDRLDAVTADLETGELSLGDALQRFEEGIHLLRHCTSQLNDAEARVEILLRENGQTRTDPFELEI